MRYSKQRDLILETLKENVVHPTADYVYKKVRQKLNNISLATVYRNLNQLASAGIIKKIEGLDEAVHFDHKTHNHYHFICTNCNKVYDMPYEAINIPVNEILTETGFEIHSYDIAFKGICHNCRKNN